MKFYGRHEELTSLRKVREISRTFARFTVVTGRRRIGKTELVRQAFDDGQGEYLHFVITKKPEKVQCAILQREAVRALNLTIHGTCERFAELFEELMKESVLRPFTLVLDEFQEFDKVDDGIFGEVAGIWDRYHNESKLNLVVCGSVNRLMNKIFFDDSQPLYGRNTGRLSVRPFEVDVLKEILADFKKDYAPDDLLSLWTISGGVARYVEQLMENGATNRRRMIDTCFDTINAFLDEGKTILSEEFGKEYGTYFTILSSIASGKTSYAEISNELGVDVGGYLSRLEAQYGLIAKKQPLYEKSSNKNCHYQIEDCFFRFWFRFVYGYQNLVEMNRLDELRRIVRRDFDVFSGVALERYFHWKFICEKRYVRMGGWWDRKGKNEIDLVCERSDGDLDVYEIKRDRNRISLSDLSIKMDAFFRKNPELKSRGLAVLPLSLADV